MKRRSFLEKLVALLGAGAVAPVAAATGGRKVELQRSPLAGFQYHRGEAVWPQLAVGTAVDLVREPENPYDPRAVRVDWHGEKLGYVPRVDNAAVSHLLDNGQAVTAEIVGLQRSRNPWDRIELRIHLRT
jgi:hypothetical protein